AAWRGRSVAWMPWTWRSGGAAAARPRIFPQPAGLDGPIGYHSQLAAPRAQELPMFPSSMRIDSYDAELAAAIAAERQRQEDHVELIASENYASPRVLEAQGSVLTNKY